jgi:hypothetical protein
MRPSSLRHRESEPTTTAADAWRIQLPATVAEADVSDESTVPLALPSTRIGLTLSADVESRIPNDSWRACVQTFDQSVSNLTSPLDTMDHGVMLSSINIPLHFEPNVGQAPPDVKFVVRTHHYVASFDSQHFSLALRQVSSNKQTSIACIVRTTFVGAHATTIIGENELVGRINYFLGSDPLQWHTDVPTFAQLRVPDLYPGVDLVYGTASDRRLAYELHIAAEASIQQIGFAFDGLSSGAFVDSVGSLVLPLAGGKCLYHSSPVMYQEHDDQCLTIEGGFQLRDANNVGFWIGNYNHSIPLIIDPLIYSTYLGGTAGDAGYVCTTSELDTNLCS